MCQVYEDYFDMVYSVHLVRCLKINEKENNLPAELFHSGCNSWRLWMVYVLNPLPVALDFRIMMMHTMWMIVVKRNRIDFDAVIFVRVSTSNE